MKARTTAKRTDGRELAPQTDGQVIPLRDDIQMLFLSGDALTQLQSIARGRDISETLRMLISEKWHSIERIHQIETIGQVEQGEPNAKQTRRIYRR